MRKADKLPPREEFESGRSFERFLARLKWDFRKWYGTISVSELVSNKDLIFEIEVLERMLAKQGV